MYTPVPPVLPVDCGTPPRGNHSTVNPTAKVYNEKADYLCDVEYSEKLRSSGREV